MCLPNLKVAFTTKKICVSSYLSFYNMEFALSIEHLEAGRQAGATLSNEMQKKSHF